MIEKQTYNYRQIMSEPIQIQKLTDKFSLPMPIKITSLVIFIIVDLLLFGFFKDFIFGLNSIMPGILLVIYIGVPYLFVKLFESLKLDGIRLDQYLLSRVNFARQISFKNHVIYHDEFVETTDQLVRFSKIRRLKIRGED